MRRRPSFSAALLGLVVTLTAVTAASIGGLAWLEQRERSRGIADAAILQAATLTAAHAGRFLSEAESAARLGPQLVAAARLDPRDDAAIEAFVLAVLRSHPQLSWVSYGDADDRFVGAWRNVAGDILVNRSFPEGGRIRLEEDRVLPEGRREAVRRVPDHGYRPRDRPYFRRAVARRDVAWTDPYEFFANGGTGITCAAPVIDGTGAVRGVFTVDLSLDRLTDFLDAVTVSPRARVFLATREGALLVGNHGRRAPGGAAIEPHLAGAVAREIGPDAEGAFELDIATDHYLGRVVPLTVGDLRWLVAVVLPVGDYTEPLQAQARRTTLLGLAVLGLAIGCGIATTRWLARPLRELATAARRIRHGDLDVRVTPPSRDEIGVLARAMADMVQALKDRDFIRDALGRYVSPELAERCLRDRQALRLGGELREVVVLMSDLRGFSELSERLGPAAMIGLLNRYLARMTPVILAHGGMINEFIGDAILVLFGAPFQRADDADRAVRCAWAMQRALAELDAEHRAQGLPELAMGIGVHSGLVVAGNIGSPDRIKYGVVGPAVNLTARLQALSEGGEVLVSEAALRRLRIPVAVSAPREVRVKGAADAVTVRRLLHVPAPTSTASVEARLGQGQPGERIDQGPLFATEGKPGEGRAADGRGAGVRVEAGEREPREEHRVLGVVVTAVEGRARARREVVGRLRA
jgi:class 3 adenylate cyclase